MRAAHVIKGAASNLMCNQLRFTAMQLEQVANEAHDAGEQAAPPDLQASVHARFADLQQAAQNYVGFMQSIGI